MSLGFHAIEFLLWGQDFNKDAPGDRPHTDYLTDASATAPNGDRRGQYLKLAATQLHDDTQLLVAAWAPDTQNYRATFTAEAPKDALRKIFQGIGTLAGAELSQERIYVAYEEQDQENEHSCFSDTTHRDILANALSIQNVYEGRFGTFDNNTQLISDPALSLHALIESVNPILAAQIRADIQAAIDAARALPNPFDSALDPTSTDRSKLLTCVEALEKATTSIVQGAAALGIENLNTQLPE